MLNAGCNSQQAGMRGQVSPGLLGTSALEKIGWQHPDGSETAAGSHPGMMWLLCQKETQDALTHFPRTGCWS